MINPSNHLQVRPHPESLTEVHLYPMVYFTLVRNEHRDEVIVNEMLEIEVALDPGTGASCNLPIGLIHSLLNDYEKRDDVVDS